MKTSTVVPSDNSDVVLKPGRQRKRHYSRYHKSFVPKKLDAIVIGSGMGSLVCAALLSRLGWKVLVLEQHTEVGGSTHVFKLEGLSHDVGVHYIGDVKALDQLWQYLSSTAIQWHKLGSANAPAGERHIYDEIRLGSGPYARVYRLPAGKAEWIAYMKSKFPQQQHHGAIDRYIKVLVAATGPNARLYYVLRVVRPLWLSRWIMRWVLGKWVEKYVTSSVTEVLRREVTVDNDLLQILCGQFGNYGVLPCTASFLTHAAMVTHYMNDGGYFPIGGSGVLADSLLPTITAAGGAVLIGQRVQQLMVRQRSANDLSSSEVYGVQMINGDVLHAPLVVCGIGLQNTWLKLCPAEKVPPVIAAALAPLSATTCFIYVFLKLNGSAKALGLRDCNIWHYPDGDYRALLTAYFASPTDQPMPLFIASNTAKDPHQDPEISSLIILTMAKSVWFDEWTQSTHNHRPVEYTHFKYALADRMIAQATTIYPGIANHILHTSVATPLTTAYFTQNFSCDSYGLDNTTVKQKAASEPPSDVLFRPQTPIKGLFVTGQDVVSTGVSGAAMSGLLTAHAIAGYGTVFDLWPRERSLMTDLDLLPTDV